MHNAPPVVFPVGRFAWSRMVLVAVCVLSAAGIFSWQTLSLITGPLLWVAWLCWVTCAVSAALWAPRQALTGGHLGWSGEAWYWQADAHPIEQAQAVQISVGLDTGHGLLLWVHKLNGQGAAQGPMACAWLQADAMPSKWHGFRCAVYSRPKAAAHSDSAARAGL